MKWPLYFYQWSEGILLISCLFAELYPFYSVHISTDFTVGTSLKFLVLSTITVRLSEPGIILLMLPPVKPLCKAASYKTVYKTSPWKHCPLFINYNLTSFWLCKMQSTVASLFAVTGIQSQGGWSQRSKVLSKYTGGIPIENRQVSTAIEREHCYWNFTIPISRLK